MFCLGSLAGIIYMSFYILSMLLYKFKPFSSHSQVVLKSYPDESQSKDVFWCERLADFLTAQVYFGAKMLQTQTTKSSVVVSGSHSVSRTSSGHQQQRICIGSSSKRTSVGYTHQKNDAGAWPNKKYC